MAESTSGGTLPATYSRKLNTSRTENITDQIIYRSTELITAKKYFGAKLLWRHILRITMNYYFIQVLWLTSSVGLRTVIMYNRGYITQPDNKPRTAQPFATTSVYGE